MHKVSPILQCAAKIGLNLLKIQIFSSDHVVWSCLSWPKSVANEGFTNQLMAVQRNKVNNSGQHPRPLTPVDSKSKAKVCNDDLQAMDERPCGLLQFLWGSIAHLLEENHKEPPAEYQRVFDTHILTSDACKKSFIGMKHPAISCQWQGHKAPNSKLNMPTMSLANNKKIAKG